MDKRDRATTRFTRAAQQTLIELNVRHSNMSEKCKTQETCGRGGGVEENRKMDFFCVLIGNRCFCDTEQDGQ